MSDELDTTLGIKSGADARFSAGGLPTRYKILSVIGSGAMGVVYRAHDLQMDRDVAIKILSLPEDSLNDSVMRERFIREAQTLALLDHPSIIKLLSWGFSDTNDLFLVMELLEGKTLAAELKDVSRLSPTKFHQIFSQIFAGLEYAHKRGIVHRDCKPSNVFLCETATGVMVKLLDFGIARNESEASDKQNLTKTGVLLGSPNYMSPEQCKFSSVDQRSDIYSAACVMHEALIGRLPHQAETAMEVMYKHVSEAAASLEDLANDPKSKRLGRLIDRCLQKDPAARPSSASEVLVELNDIFRERIDTGKLFSKLGNTVPSTLLKQHYGAVLIILILIVATLLSFSLVRRKLPSSEVIARVPSTVKPLKKLLKDREDFVRRAEKEFAAAAPESKTVLARRLYDGLLKLARIERTAGERSAAAESLDKALDLCPLTSEPGSLQSLNAAKNTVYKDMAQYKMEEGRLDEAEKIIDTGLALKMNDTEPRAALRVSKAKLLLCREQYSDAMASYEEAIHYSKRHDAGVEAGVEGQLNLYRQSVTLNWTFGILQSYPKRIPKTQASCLESIRFLNAISEILLEHNSTYASSSLELARSILDKCTTSPEEKKLEAETKSLCLRFNQQKENKN